MNKMTKEQKLAFLDLLYRDRPLSIDLEMLSPPEGTIHISTISFREAMQEIIKDIEEIEQLRTFASDAQHNAKAWEREYWKMEKKLDT